MVNIGNVMVCIFSHNKIFKKRKQRRERQVTVSAGQCGRRGAQRKACVYRHSGVGTLRMWVTEGVSGSSSEVTRVPGLGFRQARVGALLCSLRTVTHVPKLPVSCISVSPQLGYLAFTGVGQDEETGQALRVGVKRVWELGPFSLQEI